MKDNLVLLGFGAFGVVVVLTAAPWWADLVGLAAIFAGPSVQDWHTGKKAK